MPYQEVQLSLRPHSIDYILHLTNIGFISLGKASLRTNFSPLNGSGLLTQITVEQQQQKQQQRHFVNYFSKPKLISALDSSLFHSLSVCEEEDEREPTSKDQSSRTRVFLGCFVPMKLLSSNGSQSLVLTTTNQPTNQPTTNDGEKTCRYELNSFYDA